MVFMNGVINKNVMKVNGIIIKWMVKELWLGLMVENMKVNLLMIINKVMEYIIGVMVENMMVIGRIINNMVLVNIQMLKIWQEKVNGIMENELDG